MKQYIKEQEDASHDKEIEALIKSVGGGTKSAGVFESWVHIVSTLSGFLTKKLSAKNCGSMINLKPRSNWVFIIPEYF